MFISPHHDVTDFEVSVFIKFVFVFSSNKKNRLMYIKGYDIPKNIKTFNTNMNSQLKYMMLKVMQKFFSKKGNTDLNRSNSSNIE